MVDKNIAILKVKKLLNNKFETLIENLEKDLLKKYELKKKQFIYSEIFSDKTLLDLAFTSSIESKMGNILNNLLIDILRDKELANFFGWKSIEDIKREKEFKEKLYIEGKDFKLKYEYEEEGKAKTEIKILDLILINIENSTINLFEIKAGGDLDSKKGPAEVEKLKEAKKVAEHIFPNKTINIYFATLYNPKGEETNWLPSSIKNSLDESNIKIGKNFWELLFNDKLDFEDLKIAYKEVANEVNIEKRINSIENKILSITKDLEKEFESLDKKKKDQFKVWIKILCPNILETRSQRLKNIEIYFCYKEKKRFLEFIYDNLKTLQKEFRKEYKDKSYSKDLKKFLEWSYNQYEIKTYKKRL